MGPTKLAMMVFFLLGVAACGDGETEKVALDEAVTSSELIRGQYTFGHEVRSLRRCGEEEDLWVVDRTGQLQGLHGELTGSLQGDLQIFVIATGSSGPPSTEGFGADYVGTLTIDEVVYAALEGFGCDFDLTGFVYRASGNEPFWMVEVLPGSMRLSRPGHPDITWPEVALESQGKSVVLRGVGGELSGTLTIEPGPVNDSMSGAFFSHQARLDLDGEIFKGSALRGLASSGE